jgi:hypothetical protein
MFISRRFDRCRSMSIRLIPADLAVCRTFIVAESEHNNQLLERKQWQSRRSSIDMNVAVRSTLHWTYCKWICAVRVCRRRHTSTMFDADLSNRQVPSHCRRWSTVYRWHVTMRRVYFQSVHHRWYQQFVSICYQLSSIDREQTDYVQLTNVIVNRTKHVWQK